MGRVRFVLPWGCVALLAAACGREPPPSTDRGRMRSGLPEFGEGGGGAVDLGALPTAPVPRQPSGPVPGRPATPAAAPSGPRIVAASYEVVPVAGGGTIRGVCRLDAKPTPRAIVVDKDRDKGCADHPSERLVAADDLGLARCVVYLRAVKEGEAWKPIRRGKDWPETMRSPDREVAIDQKTCVYHPHVQVARPGSLFVATNSDAAEHNIHVFDSPGASVSFANSLFNNPSKPASRLEADPDALSKPSKYFVKCDIHPWMNAYVHVLPHPYFAVTGAASGGKAGEYSIGDVPPGTYDVVCWHEGMTEEPVVADGKIAKYDYAPDVERTAVITVAAGGSVAADFTLPAPRR